MSGLVSVKTESWNSRDGNTRRAEKTQAWEGITLKALVSRRIQHLFSIAPVLLLCVWHQVGNSAVMIDFNVTYFKK